MRHHHVQVTIAVNVRKRGTTTHNRLEQIAAGLRRRNRNEADAPCRTAIPEQLRRLPVLLALLHFVDLFFQVTVRGQHIEAAVQVIIEKKQPELQQQPARWPHPFGDRFVRKHQRIALRYI